MLVEKLICNARLNLLILHPFPTPSQLPQQTEAQWPIYTEVPRNKNIYLQKEGEGWMEAGWRKETERGKRREGQSVGPHVTDLDSFGGRVGRGYKCTPCLFPSQPQPQPHPLCKPLSTGIIHPFITAPILNPTSSQHTHIHRQC